MEKNLIFNSKLYICETLYSSKDFALIQQQGSLTWKRAAIQAKRVGTRLVLDGYNAFDRQAIATHDIYVKRDTQFIINKNTYLYRERHKSPSEWYKVQDIAEIGDIWRLSCIFQDGSETRELSPGIPVMDTTLIPTYKD